ncbi:diaminopimelate epimerase [Acidimicrobium ferrooxidans DSM 10331]|uniref:Diaminopimelate epimerase n=1 Tax=Acidimicrobium ferrooxidans (strain DSM 10331 / JCM 15462 / NBRC 103882 / ICP) TaxID=525909 RepID=C7LY03_ACIFD|nr:diaminopimelate epimerase [Acidimicrobium ferrooxidans]ACU53611.1 diaminopimelate epimerase [Acidimicrobium ferrooxidans DSM 10331]
MRLTKLVGAGNDFLVTTDPDETARLEPSVVVALCDRRNGVGADGVIGLDAHDAMVLYNADGSRAEMSGNGLRCLGHLVTEERGVGEVAFETDAGRRIYRRVGREGGSVLGATTMGPVSVRANERGWFVDAGNPHEVRQLASPQELASLDVASLGRCAQAHYPQGVNVEWAVVLAPDEVVMRVFERGVGETEACGTGSTAVAVALASAGLVERTSVRVRNPGGALTVEVTEPEPVLVGPSRLVASVDVDVEALRA